MERNSLYILILCLTLCCELAYSQYIPTVEEGKEWTIQLSYGLGNHTYKKYTLLCDTLIGDQVYLTIYQDYDQIVGYLREDTSLQEVYFLDVNGTVEETVFSYRGEAGDTIHLSSGDIAIKEVLYMEYFGSIRKVLVINDSFRYIEGAGSSRYGIITNYAFPFPWPNLHDLRMSNISCEIVTSTNETSAVISVYPNPFNDIIQIVTTVGIAVSYELYTIYGTKLLSGEMEMQKSLDVSTLIPGVYFLVIDHMSIKLVKQ